MHRKVRDVFVLTAVLISIGPFGIDQVLADGAIAVGVAPGGAARGYTSAIRVNEKDIDTAKANALTVCKKPSAHVSGTPEDNGSRAAKANCEVVATFRNKCAADALDPKDGTPGVGWAIGDTQQEADNEAIARCRSSAGADRREFCKITTRACDGEAK